VQWVAAGNVSCDTVQASHAVTNSYERQRNLKPEQSYDVQSHAGSRTTRPQDGPTR